MQAGVRQRQIIDRALRNRFTGYDKFKNTKLFSRHHTPVVEVRPTAMVGKFISRDDVKNVSRLLEMKYPGRQYQLAIHTHTYGWKAGEWYSEGQKPREFDPSAHYDTVGDDHPVFGENFGRNIAADLRVDQFAIYAKA